jgi:hypothetical protein
MLRNFNLICVGDSDEKEDGNMSSQTGGAGSRYIKLEGNSRDTPGQVKRGVSRRGVRGGTMDGNLGISTNIFALLPQSLEMDETFFKRAPNSTWQSESDE